MNQFVAPCIWTWKLLRTTLFHDAVLRWFCGNADDWLCRGTDSMFVAFRVYAIFFLESWSGCIVCPTKCKQNIKFGNREGNVTSYSYCWVYFISISIKRMWRCGFWIQFVYEILYSTFLIQFNDVIYYDCPPSHINFNLN